MHPDPIFQPGDKVVARATRGYALSEGRTYTVKDYAPRHDVREIGFTWPAYVTVVDDWGRVVTAHAHRFQLAE